MMIANDCENALKACIACSLLKETEEKTVDRVVGTQTNIRDVC